MNSDLLKQLEEIYRDLEQQLPAPNCSNPCGSCQECCTSRGANVHQVGELELAYLRQHTDEARVEAFRGFAERASDLEVCPFYENGCSVYAWRPLSCRLFGHYRSRDTALPEVCVFKGQEHIFERRRYFQEVPQAQRFRRLVRRASLYSGARVDSCSPPTAGPGEGAGDDLDRALALQLEGRLQEAARCLQQSTLERSAYFLYCQALIWEGLAEHLQALAALERALTQEPECPTLWFRLSCNAFQAGRLETAAQGFVETVRLDPNHAQAWGFLGCLFLQSGNAKKAMGPLSRAVALEPENPSFVRFLDMARGAT